ncbi:MAG: SDR family oxidoreductase [Verrucomicrobia bacterium]|nr:SDR family oxidoreductase [Kiritimatiellia bacterium]MCO6401071.1 SDR family oxidoreductase [Verrucomicrobiota bacterium]
MNVLLLGSSGFVGREIRRAFEGDHRVTSVSRRGSADSRAVDIRDSSALRALVAETVPDAVLLVAAYREPDFCEEHPEEAHRLNVEPARALARHLPAETRLLYVSTDYVFDGENPPYRETDSTSPISVYGQTKRDAEVALQGRANTTILRIPLQIGGGASLADCGFIGHMVAALQSPQPQQLDDVLLRFPTWTRDVAGAARFLVERGLDGIFHYSTPTGATRYALTLEVARLLGLPHEHLAPSREIIARKARRPFNSQLDDAKIRAAGYARHTPFQAVVRTVLAELPQDPLRNLA